MSKQPDFYKLLHVQRDAPAAIIKASYRAMMQQMQHHPDLGGDEATAQYLNQAVATLCDPEKRAIYDVNLALQATHFSKKPRDSAPPANQHDVENAATGKSEPNPASAAASNQYSDHQNKDTTDGRKHADQRDEPPKGSYKKSPVSSFPVKPRCPFCQANYPIPAGSTPVAYSREPRCSRCNGAATPIALIETNAQNELRKIHRYQHVTDATLWRYWPLEEALSVTMSDLSPAGCAVEIAITLEQDSVVLFDTALLNAICKVRYCRQISVDNKFIVGLEFLTLALFSTPGAIFSFSA